MTDTTHPHKQRLEAFVKDILTTDEFTPDEVTAYLFRDADGGIRISELSYVKRTDKGVGGGSWMSSDVDSADVIFAAERYLLFVDEPVFDVDTWETNVDEGQEHEQRLRYALTGEFGEWQDRPATHHYDGPDNINPKE